MQLNHGDRFQVENLIHSVSPSSPKLQSLSQLSNENKNRIVALMSGLNIGIVEDKNNDNLSNPLRRSFLVYYLSGHFDSSTSCNMSRLTISGV